MGAKAIPPFLALALPIETGKYAQLLSVYCIMRINNTFREER
jgi:hypothetical protein